MVNEMKNLEVHAVALKDANLFMVVAKAIALHDEGCSILLKRCETAENVEEFVKNIFNKDVEFELNVGVITKDYVCGIVTARLADGTTYSCYAENIDEAIEIRNFVDRISTELAKLPPLMVCDEVATVQADEVPFE